MSKGSEQFLNYNFDISAYRLLGRELITDRITALFELAKNAYDANADCLTIQFVNVSPLTKKSKIIISDDGLGMNFTDLKNKWMVIGTSSKRRERTSPKPYSRKVVGKKGIGRFAVDLIGAKLTLKSKTKNDTDWVVLETDWSKYAELEGKQLALPFDDKKEFFTDIKNRVWFEKGRTDEQGTILEIEHLNEEWTQDNVAVAYKELSKLVSPNAKLAYGFKIQIQSPYEGLRNVYVKALPIVKFATISIELKHDKNNKTQEVMMFEKGTLIKTSVPAKPFGLIDFSLYYFNQEDKRRFKDKFSIDIDGIKIYRDGIITTPFAETEANIEKQKDILGIDKRRYSGFFERLNSRDLLGFVELTDANNPGIVEATNRQDFLDSYEWKELKLFIIEEIQVIEKYLKEQRKVSRENVKSDFGRTNAELKSIKESISRLKKVVTPEVKKELRAIEADLGKLQGTVNKSIKEYSKLETEHKQRESLFFSLVSLQTYAAMFSHMTRHTIGHVLRDAEYFNNHFPNEKLNERFKMISQRIYSEFITLRTGVDFMLKFAQSDDNVEDINLSELLSSLFNNIYSSEFDKLGISTELSLSSDVLIKYNRKALEDVFDNLITNSIKALRNSITKKIKCRAIIDKNQLQIYFSDSGEGILPEDKLRIFDIFFTKTAEQGGAGIGLFMVKNRIEAMKGEIEVVENEFKPTGATFKITLPFKK